MATISKNRRILGDMDAALKSLDRQKAGFQRRYDEKKSLAVDLEDQLASEKRLLAAGKTVDPAKTEASLHQLHLEMDGLLSIIEDHTRAYQQVTQDRVPIAEKVAAEEEADKLRQLEEEYAARTIVVNDLERQLFEAREAQGKAFFALEAIRVQKQLDQQARLMEEAKNQWAADAARQRDRGLTATSVGLPAGFPNE